MKSLLRCYAVTLFMVFSHTLSAESFTTMDGTRYSNVELKRVEPDGLVIKYSDGIVKLKFQNLPKEVCEKYGYNPTWESLYLEARHSNEVIAYQESLKSIGVSSRNSPDSQLSNSSTSDINQEDVATKNEPKSAIFSQLCNLIKNFWDWLHYKIAWAFSVTTPSSATPPIPAELVANVLNKNPVQASDLGEILQKYPQQTISALRDKLINLAGTVDTFQVRGMEEERAEIKLKTQPNVNIYLFYDLKRDSPSTQLQWKINDQRLYLIPQVIFSIDIGTPREDLICIEGGPLENAAAQDAPFVSVRLKNYIPYNLDVLPYTLYFKLQR